MPGLVIAVEDPRTPDIVALLERHLAFAAETTAPENIFALDLDGLCQPSITFCSARLDGTLLGVGALKELDPTHGELKSMHTAAAARRQGVGRALVVHLLAVARQRRYQRVSLETGAMPAFEPARALYRSLGFVPCDRFGDYPDNPESAFMTRSTEEPTT